MRALFREFVADQQRTEREAKRDTTLAWMTAAFERQKRLPNLKTLLDNIGAPTVQTPGQLKAAILQLGSVYKLHVRTEPREVGHA